MGIDRPEVSALLDGRLANVSSERLMRPLTVLGQDVEITLRATSRERDHGRIVVVDADLVRNGRRGRMLPCSERYDSSRATAEQLIKFL